MALRTKVLPFLQGFLRIEREGAGKSLSGLRLYASNTSRPWPVSTQSAPSITSPRVRNKLCLSPAQASIRGPGTPGGGGCTTTRRWSVFYKQESLEWFLGTTWHLHLLHFLGKGIWRAMALNDTFKQECQDLDASPQAWGCASSRSWPVGWTEDIHSLIRHQRDWWPED